jgi:outer membrane receptor protein involved in Fe transport
MRRWPAMLIPLALGCAAEAARAQTRDGAQAAPAALSTVVVTATRAPEELDRIPADLSVVQGSEVAARDAHDMASLLALVPGVEAPPGGDAGPSSAVPAFWGLHEFDAFLLVVDGVPWGGAFNPTITSLDLSDVSRVEVLKGAAPVMYGATSFVGVVQVLHYPAGQATNEANVGMGEYGSARGDASFVLPGATNFRQSLSIDGQSLGFSDRREGVADAQLLYRSALDAGAGTLTIDADLTIVRDQPPSPINRDGAALTSLIPIDANFNPADARIDQNQYHVALGYSRTTPLGQWDTLVSLAHSDIADVRAFLHPDLSGDADTQDQRRHIDDDYVDTHLTHRFGEAAMVVVGADLLYGLGRQVSDNGNDAYTVPLDGSMIPPSVRQIPVNEVVTLDDRRLFAGQYAQIDWRPDSRWDITAGVRLNETYEHKRSSDLTLPPPSLDDETATRTDVRWSGTIGASYLAWNEGQDELVLYADYRNAFKPAALDFGADFTPDVLLPETAQSYEAGLKSAFDDGRLALQAEVFQLDFSNLVVATSSGALANAAGERLRGVELEARYQASPALALAATVAYHDARFTQYLFFDQNAGADVDVAGNELPLSPRVMASLGVLYEPPQGVGASLVVNYVGAQFLDEENVARVQGYATVAASVGYRATRWSVTFEGTNLTNQRPPVSASEFGSDSFYLLPARTLWLRLGYRL